MSLPPADQLSLWTDEGQASAGASEEGRAGAGAAPSVGTLAAAQLAEARTTVPEAALLGSMPVFRHPRAEREIRLGKALVGYECKRVRRRSIGMVVSDEGLSVRAPTWVSWSDIEVALRAKERWICAKLLDQRERARKRVSAQIDWRAGCQFPYLGEPVTVVLDPMISGARFQPASLDAAPCRHTLRLGLPHQADPDQIRDAVQAWVQRQARELFAQRVQHFAVPLGVQVTRIALSSARTRWGSASADGSIRLHWRLMHFSHSVIDYVVAHELAHLREMNHSPRFWDVVRSVMPEFDAARDQLRRVVIPD
ncbi:M48 family metallopeptidase [Aquabacterium sp.]|uniref:M48 family metallopeptidase n=1 Tax=Aquabacterium sp. TaxID=1872578 RepID=UPI00248A3CDC|nr:SprT family zinc-dependent metalloprotease [Aquabacterium sp.]MDI1349716.1 SprT family zinc-dependent metalloprotease [Aquabacterium sp.]